MNRFLEQNATAFRRILFIMISVGAISVCAQAQSHHSTGLDQSSSDQTYTQSVLYEFQAAPDGQNPDMGLIRDSSGNLYGGTWSGGDNGYDYGTVFELTPNGSDGYNYQQIYSLAGWAGGIKLQALTIDGQGNLYGTQSCAQLPGGCQGDVFELSPGSGGNWAVSDVYSFTGGSDGQDPNSVVVDSAGNVYGTTHSTYWGNQYGSFFELTTTNNQWFENTLYSFTGADKGKYGEYPSTLTMDKKGDFYGLASGAGAGGAEIIFKLHYSAEKGWVQTIVHSFQGSSYAEAPAGNLTLGSDGNFYYGAAGAQDYGCVYELTLSGEVTCLYAFTGGANGAYPGDVTFDKAGNLYGVAAGGIVNQNCLSFGCGVVYKLTPPSSGQTTWTENVLYSFTGGADGDSPNGTPVIDDAGNVYGIAYYGGVNYGEHGFGVVFKLTPNPVATTTTITKNSPNPSVTGQVVTVSLTVAQTVTANSKPTGTVTVTANTGESCIAALPPNGKPSCQLQFATAGTRTLTATYSGDAADLESVSAAVTQSTFDTTITAITKHTPDPAKVGRAVTVEFSVDGEDATKQTKPTGSVTVNASTGESCTGTLSAGGKGKCQLTFSSAGTETLTATYDGDANNAGSVAKAVKQAVE